MTKSRLGTIRAAALLFAIGIFAGAMPAPGQECNRLKGATTEQLRAFLTVHTPDDRTEPFCTELALRTLGGNRDTASVSLMFEYMTFKREPDDLEKSGMIHRIGTPYPAVEALQGFGPGSGEPPQAIIAAVLNYLSQPLTDRQKANAVEILAYYYREQPPVGVRYLLEESKKRTGSAAEGVKSAAELLAQNCPRKSRESCLQELEK
jgi:hypothetical protein